MSKLYLLGNGFDIAHGIKSRYGHFRDFMIASKEYKDLVIMLEELYGCNVDDLWCDFETALGLINGKTIYDDAVENAGKDEELEREARMQQDIMQWNAYNIRERLGNAFSDWVAQISLNKVVPFYGIDPADLFLTFNYTETLEKIYKVPETNILHIHGNQSNPIFGHGEKKFDDTWPQKNEAWVITDEAVDHARNLFEQFIKPVDSIIKEHESYFQGLKGTVEEVVIIGHSLGVVDLPYIRKIQKEATPSLWTDYFHRDKEMYATKQMQHDAIVETLLSCDIPVGNIKVVCDEDEMIWDVKEKNKYIMILKYIFDRVVALIGLLFLWPVLVIVAILVKVKMPGGPEFFVQKRVGKDGKLFNCHKFRTMTAKHNGSTVSVAGDSRITPLGAKLRHYKLDELPGLWDVLIGNMSFVGPRPDVPGYADKLQGDDRDVLKLRPGITGPATLKYRLEDEMISDYVAQKQKEGDSRPMQEIAVEYNDNVIYPDKVRLNCYYYRHYSFTKDIQMILCTVLGKNMEYAGEVI